MNLYAKVTVGDLNATLLKERSPQATSTPQQHTY